MRTVAERLSAEAFSAAAKDQIGSMHKEEGIDGSIDSLLSFMKSVVSEVKTVYT